MLKSVKKETLIGKIWQYFENLDDQIGRETSPNIGNINSNQKLKFQAYLGPDLEFLNWNIHELKGQCN